MGFTVERGNQGEDETCGCEPFRTCHRRSRRPCWLRELSAYGSAESLRFSSPFPRNLEDFQGTQMEQQHSIFHFADFELNERNFSVTKAGKVLPMEPKVFKVLQFLVHNPGRVVTKDELLNAVWNDCSVSESSLSRSVAILRRLLGDDTREPRYIATVPTVGYRFVDNVQILEDGFVPATASTPAAGSPIKPRSESLPLRVSKIKPAKHRLNWLIERGVWW